MILYFQGKMKKSEIEDPLKNHPKTNFYNLNIDIFKT